MKPTRTSKPKTTPIPAGMRAGLRSSDYGIRPWPTPEWWVDSINSMAGRFRGSTRALIAVVVEIDGKKGPGCWAHFPNPDGRKYPGVRFDREDELGPDLSVFDKEGIKVWLQVEPAGCDMSMLIDLVFKQYGSHPCVNGFGVDDEWYQNQQHEKGKPITDAEAQAWVEKVRSINPSYQVVVKHWIPSQMPPTYRDGLVFINDSQEFRSMEAMMDEFAGWGKHFAPAPVGFQFGYVSDRALWSKLSDPPLTIGNGILARVPNTADLYWVDFTAREIWP